MITWDLRSYLLLPLYIMPFSIAKDDAEYGSKFTIPKDRFFIDKWTSVHNQFMASNSL